MSRKNSLSGEIFDVGFDAASFSYDSGDDESKKSDLPANEMHCIVLSKYISSRIENLRVDNAKASDKKISCQIDVFLGLKN